MQSPKLQNWRRMRDHLHTPKSSTFLSTRQAYPWQVALQQSLLPFCLTLQRWKKYIFRDPLMPKKTHKKYVAKRLHFSEKDHLKMVSILLE